MLDELGVGGASQVGWAHRVTQSQSERRQRSRERATGRYVELARQAELFIGNGYSSLGTQVVALRLGLMVGGWRISHLFELRRFGGAIYWQNYGVVEVCYWGMSKS